MASHLVSGRDVESHLRPHEPRVMKMSPARIMHEGSSQSTNNTLFKKGSCYGQKSAVFEPALFAYGQLTIAVTFDTYDTMTVFFNSTTSDLTFKREGIKFVAEYHDADYWFIKVGYEQNGQNLLSELEPYMHLTLPAPSALFYFYKPADVLVFGTSTLTISGCFGIDALWPPAGFPALQNGGVYRGSSYRGSSYHGSSSKKLWPHNGGFKLVLALSDTGTRFGLKVWCDVWGGRPWTGAFVNFTPRRYRGPENTTWALMASAEEDMQLFENYLNINLTKFHNDNSLIPLFYLNDNGSKIVFGTEERYVTLLPRGKVPKSISDIYP